MIIAPLPEGTEGHFGAGPAPLRADAIPSRPIDTLPRLTALLQSVGLAISQREVQRLLTEKHDDFLDEARDVLRAGLETSPWVSVDDTGARHKTGNGFCTQIGNDRFTWFGTRQSKSRLNFLDLLRAGHTDFVLNDMAFTYMRNHALPAPLIARLAGPAEAVFADHAAWSAHLDRLGFTGLTTTPNPVQIATGRGPSGAASTRTTSCADAVVLECGRCRTVRKWDAMRCAGFMQRDWCTGSMPSPTCHPCRSAADAHADLELLCRSQGVSRRSWCKPPSGALRARFDRIFRRRTGFVTLDRFVGAPPRQQDRVVDGARPTADATAHQRLRKRYSLPGHAAEGQRRNTQRSGAGLPRRLPRPYENLHQAWCTTPSGTILVAGSISPGATSSRRCRTSSAVAASPSDTVRCPGFCRYYRQQQYSSYGWLT